jgi:hypothetical protein
MAAPDPLAAGFADPPGSARPRVWWHWMNGNITPEGITADLAWMKRIGIGGLQNFDAALATPQIVPERLAWMTPKWQDAFRGAVAEADAAGLEFAIASSPGWSETGGPWVPAEDGIKKLVWSERTAQGGAPVGVLPPLPCITGPFQAVPKKPDPIAAVRQGPLEQACRDTVVLAFPAARPQPLPARRLIGDVTTAVDASGDAGFELPLTPEGAEVRYDFPEPVSLQSATLAFDSGGTLFTPPRFLAVLEAAGSDGAWRKVADFPAGPTPQYTISFPAETARAFRIRFVSQPAKGLGFTPVAGAIPAGVGNLGGGKRDTLPVAAVNLASTARVHRFEEKAGFETPFDYHALATVGTLPGSIDPSQVIDVSRHLTAEGRLDWTPPAGHWTVLRLGWSLTGKENHPATLEATGLEVDKYDAAAVTRYIDTYLDRYEAVVGKDRMGAAGIRALLNDSIEVGPANWTPRLIAEFRARRGYDPVPWLPALTGTLIGSPAKSDAFLYDYRRTLADLIAQSHYATIAARAKARGLRTYAEALEFGRPSLGDDMAMRAHADVPMAAMWTWTEDDVNGGDGVRPVYHADIRGAASVAHIHGQNVVALEALTSAWAPWAFAPRQLRPMIDLAFALGVNLPVIHTSVHQPVTEKAPGLSLAIFGQHFNRLDTWAGQAKPWVDYLARTSFLLQQGRNVADVLYFHGEEAPLTALYNAGPPADAPRQNEYDFANPDVLMTKVQPRDGALATASGQRYRLLWLGGSSHHMTLAMLRRVADIVRAGVPVGGLRPKRSPALVDQTPAAEAAYRALIAELWDGGRVMAADTADAALRKIGVPADFAHDGEGEILFRHRALPDGRHIWFLSNRAGKAQNIAARFAVSGLRAEQWDTVTGRRDALAATADGSHSLVRLKLPARGSTFVLFAPESDLRAGPSNERVLATWEDGWSLDVAGRAAPARVGSWTARDDARHFSGTAIYSRRMEVPPFTGRLLVDLGDVGDVAEVLVDGKSAGIAWTRPWRVELTELVRPNSSVKLEIRVTNRWVNRLIGDAQPGATRVGFTTVPTYAADAPLRPSGLLAPVSLIASEP